MALTYASYLKIQELLRLQQPQSAGPAHDELLFIIAHQSYELWFKQLLHELDRVQARLAVDDADGAQRTLTRVVSILRVLVAQVDVLETMTPAEFGTFRADLGSASGFQSVQFRELEFALGLQDEAMLERVRAARLGHERLQRRYQQPSLWDSFLTFMARLGHEVPPIARQRDDRDADAAGQWRQQLTAVLRRDACCARVGEQLLDIDSLLIRWRHRHVLMVARMIGSRAGTGGSSGVAYLETTLSRRCFPDLWAVRGDLLDHSACRSSDR